MSGMSKNLKNVEGIKEVSLIEKRKDKLSTTTAAATKSKVLRQLIPRNQDQRL